MSLEPLLMLVVPVCATREPCRLRRHSVEHRLDFCLISNDSRGSVVSVVIVYSSIAPTAMIANPLAAVLPFDSVQILVGASMLVSIRISAG